jgi:hypothetical protein
MSESKLYWWNVKDHSGERFRIKAEFAHPGSQSVVLMVGEDIVAAFTNWASYYREDVVADAGRIDVPSGSVYRNGPLPKVEPQDEEVATDAEISEHAEERSDDEDDIAKIGIRIGEDGRKWRLLGPDEVVQDGDWVNSKGNPTASSWPLALPPRGGWIKANTAVGRLVKQSNDMQEFIREVK